MSKKNRNTNNFQKNLNFAYKVMEKKIAYIKTSLNLVNTKITFLSALVGVILAFYIPLFISNVVVYPFYCRQYWVQIFSFIFPVLSLFCLLFASIPKKFNDPTKSDWLCSDEILNSDHLKIKHQVILGMKNVYKTSVENHSINIFWLKSSIILIFIGILFIIGNIWQMKIQNQTQHQHRIQFQLQ